MVTNKSIDQRYWAHQIEALGLGPTPVPIERATSRVLADRIGRVLQEPTSGSGHGSSACASAFATAPRLQLSTSSDWTSALEQPHVISEQHRSEYELGYNPRVSSSSEHLAGRGGSMTVLRVCALVLFSLAGQAGQLPSVSEGVYSTVQAGQGQEIYHARCAECHGVGMEGSSGPPLVGASFLANWSAHPLATVVDKIQRTMPFNEPGTLSRVQSTSLLAYMLQVGRFPAGKVDLSDAILEQITFPVARTDPASGGASPTGAPLPPPEGNLAELMRAIAFPNSNIIFNVQVKDPGVSAKKDLASSPFDYVAWGASVYPGWLAVDQAAIALTETAALLLTPGRRCQNGRPVPVDHADWQRYVAALADAGKLAHRASQARNFEAFVEVSDKLNDACANCHKVYRDRGGSEGSGAGRCQ
jgi:mono/diheme cytochrome c family protein